MSESEPSTRATDQQDQPGPIDTSENEPRRSKPQASPFLLSSLLETSKSASQAYLLYMTFLAYCSLTIFTTSDAQIMLNESMILPLINLPVSSRIFLGVAPIIAIGLFIHFEFYHYRLTRM